MEISGTYLYRFVSVDLCRSKHSLKNSFNFESRYLFTDFIFRNDPFEDLFGGRFHFQDQDITLFHKLSVTTR